MVAKKGGGIVSDLVKITFRMNESNVYIRSGNNAPILSASNNAVFNLPKGEHIYRFFKEGFNDLEKKVKVEKEEIVDVTLVPGTATTKLALSGWVTIESEPTGAEVFLNDQRVGTTPFQLNQTAGRINLRLHYPLYYDYSEQFELGEGATV
ncbi:MAG: PEGA domain-containing protein, partial [Nitrospiraceae bacterium]